MTEVTRILEALHEGDEHATDRLLEVLYQELHRLAAVRLAREPAGQTLQTTALVHEAYLRLVGDEGGSWDGRGHFFAAAAEAMRRILIDRARRKARLKHGGGRQRQPLQELELAGQDEPVDILALNEALEGLARHDGKKAQLVKLRFFAGLPVEEAASLLGISRSTADRQWAYAKAWLYDAMSR